MVSKNKIKWVQSLKKKKYRLQNNAFVAEGDKLVGELLHSNITVREVFATSQWLFENEGMLSQFSGIATEVTARELDQLSHLQSPQPAVAICDIPEWPSTQPAPEQWSFYLDDIRDPGNLGTIIRTADWFGLTALFCSLNTVDCYNPKVIQATMGSIARVKVVYRELGEISGSLPLYAAAMEGTPVQDLVKAEQGIVVIGNEAHGIAADILHKANPITIPRKGGAESLNAAMAAGIIMSRVL